MTAQETNVSIAAESTLSSSLSAGSTTINVTDTSSFPAVPFYVVIDPDQNATREVVLVDDSKTATTFTLSAASKRGQDGTTDTAHSSGAKVACVPVPGLWTDINDRVDAAVTDAAAAQATADAAYTPGGTVVAIADGGTGASTTAAARTALGAVGRSDTDASPFTFVLDEDNMASNSATKLPTQQSVKAYVDRSRSARATRTTTYTVADATLTAVPLEAAALNFDTMWAAGSPTRLTVTTAGTYLVTAFVQWTGSTDTDLRLARIRLNGATAIVEDQRANINGWNSSTTLSSIYTFSAADYMELAVRQDSGGSLDLLGTVVFGAVLLHP